MGLSRVDLKCLELWLGKKLENGGCTVLWKEEGGRRCVVTASKQIGNLSKVGARLNTASLPITIFDCLRPT
jgi:hypothetical protein